MRQLPSAGPDFPEPMPTETNNGTAKLSNRSSPSTGSLEPLHHGIARDLSRTAAVAAEAIESKAAGESP